MENKIHPNTTYQECEFAGIYSGQAKLLSKFVFENMVSFELYRGVNRHVYLEISISDSDESLSWATSCYRLEVGKDTEVIAWVCYHMVMENHNALLNMFYTSRDWLDK